LALAGWPGSGRQSGPSPVPVAASLKPVRPGAGEDGAQSDQAGPSSRVVRGRRALVCRGCDPAVEPGRLYVRPRGTAVAGSARSRRPRPPRPRPAAIPSRRRAANWRRGSGTKGRSRCVRLDRRHRRRERTRPSPFGDDAGTGQRVERILRRGARQRTPEARLPFLPPPHPEGLPCRSGSTSPDGRTRLPQPGTSATRAAGGTGRAPRAPGPDQPMPSRQPQRSASSRHARQDSTDPVVEIARNEAAAVAWASATESSRLQPWW